MNLLEVLSGRLCAALLVNGRGRAMSWDDMDSKSSAKAKIKCPAR